MLDNRNDYDCYCDCKVSCISVISVILIALLTLVAGAILGGFLSTFIVDSIVPIAILGIVLLLAVAVILFFRSCKCKNLR